MKNSFGKIWRMDEALREAAEQVGIDRRLKEQRVIDEWNQLVGDAIARAATVKRFERGRLTLRVINAVWRQELSLGKERLRFRINEALGEEIVEEIILR